jgi:hypothetical protein
MWITVGGVVEYLQSAGNLFDPHKSITESCLEYVTSEDTIIV